MAITALLRDVLIIGGLVFGQAARAEGEEPLFTKEERVWMSEHPVLRVSVGTSDDPIEYMEGGRLRGLSSQYLNKVAQKTGLKFTYVTATSSQDRIDMLERRHADLISARRVNAPSGYSEKLLDTQPYYLSSGIIVTRVKRPFILTLDQLNGMTVTVPSPQRYTALLSGVAPNATLIVGVTSRRMLRQVADGTADAAIGEDGYLLPDLYRGYQGQLQVAGVIAEMTTGIGMSVRRDQPILHSILHKALASITLSEERELHASWLAEHMTTAPRPDDLVHRFLYAIALFGPLILLLSAVAFQTHRMRQKAERNEREKTMFLAVMSHEIRSPMNSVLAAVELLRNTSLDKQQQHYADLANRGAHTLLTLIDDVLNLTKLEAGQMELVLEPSNIAVLVRNVIELNQLAAEERAISLTCDGDIQPPLLMLDGTRLTQVMNNLVSNAIKFTEAGGVTVRYAICDNDIPGTVRLRISVVDTGIGISAEAQARLFRPYAQVERPFNRSGGTGLGLVISRDLVKLMQGDISLMSQPGEGTTIEVSLPVQLAPTAVLAAESPGHMPYAARPPVGLRILVVEDTPTNQAVLLAQLKEFGCTAIMANTGGLAIASFANGVYDLVLMDCDLPDSDGYALANQFRLMEQDRAQARCPIIAISASTGADHVARCFGSGMDGILSKPIRMGKLKDTIELWCGVTLPPAAKSSSGHDTLLAQHVGDAMRDDLRDLLEFVALQDADGASRAAHRLLGASLTVKWPELSNAARAMESLLRDGPQWSDPMFSATLHQLAQCLRGARPPYTYFSD